MFYCFIDQERKKFDIRQIREDIHTIHHSVQRNIIPFRQQYSEIHEVSQWKRSNPAFVDINSSNEREKKPLTLHGLLYFGYPVSLSVVLIIRNFNVLFL